MHVLVVTNYFAPEGGAAAMRLTRLARKLRQRGHRVTVLTSLPHYPKGRIYDGHRGRLWMTTDSDGIRVVQTWLFATPNPRISRKLVSQLSFMLSAGLLGLGLPRPDVLLVEGQPIFTGLAGVLLATVKRRPYVFNVSDLWPEHLLSVGALSETDIVYRLARKLVDTMYRRASAIVAITPGLADTIAGHVDRPDKVRLIRNGVDLTVFRPCRRSADTFRQKHGLDGRRIVSFIGTFSTAYDFDLMMQVASRLGSDERVQIVFIGQGSQEEAFRRHLDTVANVRWIPWISPHEVPAAWNASDVTYFALRRHPLYEGTIPAKLYEAMACGVPVVAALEGSGAELITSSGAGIAVPCEDAAGLAGALEKMLTDDAAWQRCAAAARDYAKAHFDADRVVDAYEQTLLTAMAPRPAGTGE